MLLKTELQLLACVSNVVYLYDLQMSIVKYFSVVSIKSELENIEKVAFLSFFMDMNISDISNMKQISEIKVSHCQLILI